MTLLIKSIPIAAAFLLSFGNVAFAQFAQQAKIVSDNRESRAEYGTSVDIMENFAIVGASRETIASGAAYVYSKDSQGNWSYLQRLAANDPNEGAEFGGGVEFGDDFVVVAAGRADIGSAQRAGALYVYDNINGNWEINTKLTASDLTSEAKLGMNPTSLDLDGNTIIAGAPGDNQWTGSVYVFTETAGVWTEAQKILSPTAQVNDVFGVGVAISGDYLVVGANEVNGRKGAAYVYLKNANGIWEYNQTLMASDATNDSFFGTAVSIAGNQMVIGAYGANSEAGAAYIFERDSQGSWQEVQRLEGNPSSEPIQFGWSTAIQQNYISVSAPHIFGAVAGEVYFYERENSGNWVEEQVVQGTDTAGEDFYGWSVAMHAKELIVGAPWEDHDENGGNEIDRAGSAYIFENPSILGIENNFSEASKTSLFPNPVQSHLTIQTVNNSLGKIQIYAMNGSLLKEMNNINTQQITMDLSSLAAGIYLANIIFEDGSIYIEKVIKSTMF